MRTASNVIAELRASGQLWEHAPGLVGLRGDAHLLQHALGVILRRIGLAEGGEEWQVPPAISFDTLARADYFASFPQWLTAAAHLDPAQDVLDRVAASRNPASEAVAALRPDAIALQPAVCYHVYAALAGAILEAPHCCTTAGTCWRHEGDRFAPLERGWAFTMREIVCVGTAAEVAGVRARGLEAAITLASELDLNCEIAAATDPFYAPSTRGRALMQRVRALKHELLLPIGGGRTVAAASFNDHAQFFGGAFDIRLRDGSPAASSCIAFGVERWTLAVLVEHGTSPEDWPARIGNVIGEEGHAWLQS